jgi:predicted alpha/beta hydrolase family esterase
MKQVIVIHGGTTFEKYDDYLASLTSKSIYPERMTFKLLWKERLQASLGDEYSVLLPTMPNKTNARYAEWKLWFDNISRILENDCILVGHSMGAIFLAKYLSQNTLDVRIKGTILVATPYDDESVEDLTDFKLDSISDLFTSQAGDVYIINGNDDPVISHADIQKYKHDLPRAQFITVSAPDHFMRESFPELLEIISAI